MDLTDSYCSCTALYKVPYFVAGGMGNANAGNPSSAGMYGNSQPMSNGLGNAQGSTGSSALDTLSQAYAGIQQYAGLSGLLSQGKYSVCGLALLPPGPERGRNTCFSPVSELCGVVAVALLRTVFL